MNEHMDGQHRARGTAVLLLLVLLGVMANTLLTVELREHVTSSQQTQQQRFHLPCPAIPMRLVVEHPQCVQWLIEEMGVTNMRVVVNESDPRGRPSQADVRVRNDSGPQNYD